MDAKKRSKIFILLACLVIQGVGADLRVRPFFHHGGTISIREFVVGALNAEMGLQPVDPDLLAASSGARITTPAGMVLEGSLDAVEAPRAISEVDDPDDDGIANRFRQASSIISSSIS